MSLLNQKTTQTVYLIKYSYSFRQDNLCQVSLDKGKTHFSFS